MNHKRLLFFSFVLIACFLLIAGAITSLKPNTLTPESVVFYVLSGLIGIAGLIGIYTSSDKKE